MEECFTIIQTWWAKEFVGVTGRGMGVGGVTGRSRDGWKTSLQSSPPHGQRPKKAATVEVPTTRLASSSRVERISSNSAETVYHFHNLQDPSWWSLSVSASQVMWCLFTSSVLWATPLLGGGDASIQRKLLYKRRAFSSKVWFSWGLNDGGWEYFFKPLPHISQVTSWSHWPPVHRGEGCLENRKWSIQW